MVDESGNPLVPRFFTTLSSDQSPPLAKRKSRTGQHIGASQSGLDLASLNHIKSRQYRLAMASRARALMCLSKSIVCRRRLLLFLLAGLLLCLLCLLSHVTLRDPTVGSMQVDFDMQKYKVHHNCKIDTARFEEGKRRSHRSALRVDEPFSRCVGAIRRH